MSDDPLPEGIHDLAAHRDAELGTLDAGSLHRAGDAATLLTHVDMDAGAIAGFGFARIDSDRAVLHAFTHPHDPRAEAEIIGALAEAIRSRRMLEDGWLRIERVLRPNTPPITRDLTLEYERLGFKYFYTEQELQRELTALSETGTLSGIAIAPWTRERDADVREAYNDAFRDRGFTGFDEHTWARESFAARQGFRPDLSVLAFAGETLVGFCLCENGDEPAIGWIDTLGVRPAHRRRGLGTALVVASVHAMRAAGLERAALRVNEDNDRARRLYDRLGFRPVKRHVVYRKRVG